MSIVSHRSSINFVATYWVHNKFNCRLHKKTPLTGQLQTRSADTGYRILQAMQHSQYWDVLGISGSPHIDLHKCSSSPVPTSASVGSRPQLNQDQAPGGVEGISLNSGWLRWPDFICGDKYCSKSAGAILVALHNAKKRQRWYVGSGVLHSYGMQTLQIRYMIHHLLYLFPKLPGLLAVSPWVPRTTCRGLHRSSGRCHGLPSHRSPHHDPRGPGDRSRSSPSKRSIMDDNYEVIVNDNEIHYDNEMNYWISIQWSWMIMNETSIIVSW